MRLRELQREMQRDLFGERSLVADAIVDAPPLPVEARLDIYRNAYRSRLIEALDETYPVLHQILGDDTFSQMAEIFIAENPSRHRSIRWYGAELAAFLEAHDPFAEQPILAELARFEWTLSEAFDSADASAIERSDLMSIDPADWPGLTFRFHPSLRRLTFRWNTVAVWKAMSAGADPPAPERALEPVDWLIWRQRLENYFRSLDGAESAALTAASRGATFEAICGELGSHLVPEEVPLRAATLVAAWADSGTLVHCRPAAA